MKDIHIKWFPPVVDWVALNFDGALLHTGGAWCGGSYQNNFRLWVMGFAKNLDNYSVLTLELSGVWEVSSMLMIKAI